MNEETYLAASKIRSSAAFGEIIILIVYLPLLALAGIEGKMFGPWPKPWPSPFWAPSSSRSPTCP
jgi:Cu/Ag efflux pump CusA